MNPQVHEIIELSCLQSLHVRLVNPVSGKPAVFLTDAAQVRAFYMLPL